jgi:hypothetical protein
MDVLISAATGICVACSVVLACDAWVWVGRRIEADRAYTRLQEQARKLRGLPLCGND